jgi:hypothetical protein
LEVDLLVELQLSLLAAVVLLLLAVVVLEDLLWLAIGAYK